MRLAHVAVCAAVLLQSCASLTNVAARRYLGVQIEPPVPADTVKILPQPPEAYRQIGEIRVEWPGLRSEQDVLQDPAIQQSLKSAAGRMGADAVVLLHFLHRLDGTAMSAPSPAWLVTMAISTRPPVDRRRGILLTRHSEPLGATSTSVARR